MSMGAVKIHEDVAQHETEVMALEDEMAKAAGVLNVATANVVNLIAQVIATNAWVGEGISSPTQWVSWRLGVSSGRASAFVAMATRLSNLPCVKASFEAGELSEDQTKVLARHAPTHIDAEVVEFARATTVAQLRRSLSKYVFGRPKPKDDEPESAPVEQDKRYVRFGSTDSGRWYLSGELDPDEGAVVESALHAARQELFSDTGDESPDKVTWADALVAMADRSMSPGAGIRSASDRHLFLVHTDVDDPSSAHLHLGSLLDDELRQLLGCDATTKAVYEKAGVALSVGRASRIVPERARRIIEDRDGGCRRPDCDARRWLNIHHVIHWEHGGPTDTANLIALCAKDHRLVHRGLLGIEGDNADDPGGVTFTDTATGRVITPVARPSPPVGPLPEAAPYRCPEGGRLDYSYVSFSKTPEPVPDPATS